MTGIDETLQVDTPENVFFGYTIAGIGSRFLAAMIDTAIISGFQAVVLATLLLTFSLMMDNLLEELGQLGLWLAAILSFLNFFCYWVYYIFFEMIWNGQSPGKRAVGLRVLRVDGMPPGFSESLVRNLFRTIDMLPALYGVGVVTMFIQPQARRLGDLAAGTLVVREQAAVTLDSLEKESRAVDWTLRLAKPGPALPVERLAPGDFQLAEEYLKRRGMLSNRLQLAQQIAGRLQARLGLPAQELDPAEAERLIMQVVRAGRE